MWLNVSVLSGREAMCVEGDCQTMHRTFYGAVRPFNPSEPCEHIPVARFNDRDYARISRASLCDCGCGVLILRPAQNLNAPSEISASNARGLCEYCNATPQSNRMVEFETGYQTMLFCTDCYRSRVRTCQDCESRHLISDSFTIVVSRTDEETILCEDCYGGYQQCRHCRNYFPDGESCCEEVDEDDCNCYDCRRSRGSDRGPIRNYSFKPEPVFHAVGDELRYRIHPEYRNRYDATPYLGFELEVEVPADRHRSKVAKAVQAGLGDVAYLKEDGSINHGFEIVTHPMTLDYAMTKFNWKIIRELRRSNDLGTGSNCGLHVHVSKAGFSGPTHEYRWLLFWHRNQKAMIQLAGRDSSYARYITEQRAMFRRVAERKPTSMERYSAINTINDATYEVRVFASTLFINRLKASLQLVDATVEYTRNLAAAKVMHDGGFSWAEFVVWLRTNARRYPDLITRIRDVVKLDNTTPETTFVNMPSLDRHGYANGYSLRNVVTQEKVNA